ncbi:hypothetical protein [Halorussus sp. AFM4]|uniref:hypothetical protein n=1 Tax=Halorussus sp. AFM4 TaxID=3421651 RepID=UPI003EB7A4F0
MRGEFMDKYWWVIAGLVGGVGGLWTAVQEGDLDLGIMSAGFTVCILSYAQLKRKNRQLQEEIGEVE